MDFDLAKAARELADAWADPDTAQNPVIFDARMSAAVQAVRAALEKYPPDGPGILV
jgi:hypothetical protein